MGAETPIQSFRRLHAIFEAHSVPHALIGGWAAVAWGVVRATRDVDLLADIGRDLQDAKMLLDIHKGRLDEAILGGSCALLKVTRVLTRLRGA